MFAVWLGGAVGLFPEDWAGELDTSGEFGERDRAQCASLIAPYNPSTTLAQFSTRSPLRKSSTTCSCATGSLPATTVATITSQRSLKASDSTDFADGAPTR